MIYIAMESEIEYINEYVDSQIDNNIENNKSLYYVYKVEPNVTYLEEDLDNLPGDLQIFTLPITTSLHGCNFDIIKIFNYFPLSLNDIISIQTDSQIRTLQPNKKHLKYNSTIDNFMHQITVIMTIFTDMECKNTKLVNIKLFGNNAIQVTGLLSIFQCNYTINKLLRLLKGQKGFFIDQTTKKLSSLGAINSKFTPLRFIDSDDIYIGALKISTINLTYQYIAPINQIQFYFKMQELKLKRQFDPNVTITFQSDIAAPVTISLPFKDEKYIVIFIFESGIISLLACKNREHVIFAFDFIIKILKEQHEYIIKKDMLSIIANDEHIKQYIDMKALSALYDKKDKKKK
jgi:hypothetical protein